MTHEELVKFSLRNVLADFRTCLTDENKNILMDPYIRGWKGLITFMNSLGTVFTFVSKDAVAKIHILESYRSGANGEQYISLKSMMEFELSGSLLDLKKRSQHPDSGCRTVLRLHRALHWLQLFLDKLRTSNDASNTSTMCTDAYNDSLANFHPWLIRKTASVAFCALPPRDTFFQAMNVGTAAEVITMLNEAMPHVDKVYEVTQELYVKYNLLNLP